jgi:hypothetical protein
MPCFMLLSHANFLGVNKVELCSFVVVLGGWRTIMKLQHPPPYQCPKSKYETAYSRVWHTITNEITLWPKSVNFNIFSFNFLWQIYDSDILNCLLIYMWFEKFPLIWYISWRRSCMTETFQSFKLGTLRRQLTSYFSVCTFKRVTDSLLIYLSCHL